MERDLTNATVEQIADFYSLDEPVWLRANMVISADGHFVDANGSSRGLSGPLDLKVLLTLRAISDAVLVGASTVRIENYQTPRLVGDFNNLNNKPARLVILSKSLDFDLSSRLFMNQENQPIMVTQESPDQRWLANLDRLSSMAQIVVMPDLLSMKAVISHLNKIGLHKIVSEGGPQVLSELLAENLVDELDITKSPIFVGHQAKRTNIHDAIDNWPNRLGAKLGSHHLWRIKH